MEIAIEVTDYELRQKYKSLCFRLGKDEDAENLPKLRDKLIRKIGALAFEEIHDYYSENKTPDFNLEYIHCRLFSESQNSKQTPLFRVG